MMLDPAMGSFVYLAEMEKPESFPKKYIGLQLMAFMHLSSSSAWSLRRIRKVICHYWIAA